LGLKAWGFLLSKGLNNPVGRLRNPVILSEAEGSHPYRHLSEFSLLSGKGVGSWLIKWRD